MKKSVHNLVNSPTYRTWANMKSRCLNKNVKGFKHYGAKGIGVDKKWLTFDGFLEDMGVCPKGFTIDRIDNSKGYLKENCRWATYKQQNNNFGCNRRFTFDGRTLTLSEWAKKLKTRPNVLSMRIDYYGWELSKALTTRPRKQNRKR